MRRSYYTLLMIDPDVPSRNAPLMRNFVHWMVVNIPGLDISKGSTRAEYVMPQPPPGTGFHRYIFFVFNQGISMRNFDENYSAFIDRGKFSVRNFAAKYNLGNPWAGSFTSISFSS